MELLLIQKFNFSKPWVKKSGNTAARRIYAPFQNLPFPTDPFPPVTNIRSPYLIGLPPAWCNHWYDVMYAQSMHATSESSKSCGTLKTKQNDGTNCVWFRNSSERQLRPFLVHCVYESSIRRKNKPLTTLQNRKNIWQSTVKGLIDWNREKNRNHRWDLNREKNQNPRCTHIIVYREIQKLKPPMWSEPWEKPKPPMHLFNSIQKASYRKKNKGVNL